MFVIMFETILTRISSVFAAIPFSGATWFTIGTLVFFTWVFAKASRDPLNPIKWEHLIIDSQNNRASPYKLGYIIGVIVSTWIVIRFADRQTLNFDILGMYLTYLVTGAGVNSFVKAKEGVRDRVETTVIQTSATTAPPADDSTPTKF